MNPDEITKESLPNLDIKSLALNKEKFGSLAFDAVYPFLGRLQNLFKELQELSYQDALSQPEVSQIDQYIDSFVNHLKQLASFDLSVGFNKDQHDNFETNTRNFYDEVFRNLRNNLVYLRQEAALKSQDAKELQKQQKAAVQAEKEYKVLSDKLKQQLEALGKREQEVEVKHGEIAAITFGKHFEAQAKEYVQRARDWEARRIIFFKWLLFIIIANLGVYLYLFISDKLDFWPNFPPKEIFTIEYGAVKLALLGLLSYAVGFASKNYSANSHLEIINKHRKNVAETLKDFLSSKPEPEDKSVLVRSGADAMFRGSATGYVSKGDPGGNSNEPVGNFISSFLGSRRE